MTQFCQSLAERDYFPTSAFNITDVMSCFYCVWNPQISFHLPLLFLNLWHSYIFWAFHPLPVTIFTKTKSRLREHFHSLQGRYGLWWSVVGNGAALPAAPTSRDLCLSRVVLELSWAPARETRLTGSASIAACWAKATLTKALFIVLFTIS